MSLHRLLEWNTLTGELYGSEDQSMFFYSYVKMQQPETILELGAGLGHSAFWMGQALQELGRGHLWSVENGADWPTIVQGFTRDSARLGEQLRAHPAFQELFATTFPSGAKVDTGPSAHLRFLTQLTEVLGLTPRVSFLRGELSFGDTVPVNPETTPFLSPALAAPIDLLYADFGFYPHTVLSLLAKYLPLLSEHASIFIDSASTYLPSYLILERTVEQLNQGKIPALFLAGATRERKEQLAEIVATRRFTFIPMAEKKDREQNGLAWIRMEPVNVVPYPLTRMRGFSSKPVPLAAVESFFEQGRIPDEHLESAGLMERLVHVAGPLSNAELNELVSHVFSLRRRKSNPAG